MPNLIPGLPSTTEDKGKEAEKETKPEVPKVSVNAPDGSEKTLTRATASPPVGGSGYAKVRRCEAAMRIYVIFFSSVTNVATSRRRCSRVPRICDAREAATDAEETGYS